MIVGLALVGPAAAERTLTAEDVVRLEQASDPQISPGGDHVAYVVTAFRDDRTRDADIWLVSVEGGDPQRITNRPGDDNSPRWSVDGAVLAFVAHPDGEASQIELVTLADGKSSVLSGTEGVNDFRWSPDGTRVALLRKDPLTEDEARRKERGDDAWVVGQDEPHTGLWLLNLDSGATRRISPPGQTVWSFRWSPDGNAIAALSSSSPAAEGLEYGSRLVVFDLDHGVETVLAQRTNPQAAPCFSPNGKWIAYLGPVGQFKERGVIHVVPSEGGAPRQILRDFPGNVWDLRWHPKQDRLLAGVAEGSLHHLSLVTLAGSSERLLEMRFSITPYWNAAWTVSGDGGRVAFLSEEGGRPANVWTARSDGSDRRQLTRLNRFLDDVQLGKVEAIRWRNPEDDAVVEGILVTPPGGRPDQRLPLILWLHGGPAYNWGVASHIESWAQLFAAHGYAVLLPNFRGSSGYGMDWMMANVRNWGDGPLGDILSGADHLIRQGLVDPQRQFVGGGSYGGFLTYWTITHTQRFRAAFTRAGVSDITSEYALTDEPSFLVGYFNATPYDEPELYREASPLSYASAVQTPLLIIHGERDARVPLSQSHLLRSALEHSGVPVQLVVYPREGHGVREYAHQIDAMRRALAWYARWDAPSAPGE